MSLSLATCNPPYARVEVFTNLSVNTFHTVRADFAPGPSHPSKAMVGYLLPVTNLISGRSYSFVEVVGTRAQDLPLRVFRSVDTLGEPTEEAYLVSSPYPIENLHTGLFQTFRSWQSQVANPAVENDEVFLALKMPGLYVYCAANKATVVTTADLDSRLEDLLVAI